MVGDKPIELSRDHIRRGLIFHGKEFELDPTVHAMLVKAPNFTMLKVLPDQGFY